MTKSSGPDRVVVSYSYPPDVKSRYEKDYEFDHWFVKYYERWPFHPSILNNNQIPHSHRPPEFKGTRSFNEAYMATQYLHAGYDVHWLYRGKEAGSDASYQEAKRLLGEAGNSIQRFGKGGEPPDLLVVEAASSRFRFVECKGPSEPFTKNQVARFLQIESALNNNPPPCREPLSFEKQKLLLSPQLERLFPELPNGHWIHVVRVVPGDTPQDSDKP